MNFIKPLVEAIKYWAENKFSKIENALDEKQPIGDYALKGEIPEIPKTLPNPQYLTFNGKSYDGSAEVRIDLRPDWNEKEEEHPNFIRNKPFGEYWTYIKLTDFICESSTLNLQGVYLRNGYTYKITNSIVNPDFVCYDEAGYAIAGEDNEYIACFNYEDCGIRLAQNDKYLSIEVDVSRWILPQMFFLYECKQNAKLLDEKYIPDTVARVADVNAPKTEFVLASATENSSKQFKITIGDDGVLVATEIVDNET